jgi:hypothetical protein
LKLAASRVPADSRQSAREEVAPAAVSRTGPRCRLPAGILFATTFTWREAPKRLSSARFSEASRTAFRHPDQSEAAGAARPVHKSGRRPAARPDHFSARRKHPNAPAT